MTDSTLANTSADPTGNEEVSPRVAVGTIAGLLAGDGFLSSGERATLRRVDPACPVTPALWRVLGQTHQLAPDGLSEDQKRRWERRWGLLILGMAHVPGLHRYEVALGAALAQAGWSEMRFVRLMEAGADALPVLVRRMAQYLASKEQPANWDDVRQLLFSVDRDYSEDVRLRIARSYYRTLYAQEQDD
jgi:CRISPR system Cascade subunit CasB